MAKKKKDEVKELEQTQGTFKLKGLAKNLDRDNAYEEAVKTDGPHNGEVFRKLNIGIQTSENNQIRVGMFSYEPELVFMWNSEKKKKDKSYKGDRVPWDEYLEQKDILKENGSAVLQARVGVEYNDNDKLESHGLTTFEASELIHENIDNDDSVYVEGQISYSQYEDRSGKKQTGVNYNLNRLFLAKDDFDLEDEEYEEQNYYEQQFVYVDSNIVKDEKKLYVIGRIIDYRKNVIDTTFVVNYGEDEGMERLAKNIKKQFKFGDLVTVFGEILNQAIEREAEDEDSGDLTSLGGKSQPSYAKRTSYDYNREMTIDGVLEWKKGHYTEEDFANNETVVEEEEDEDLSSELGGKKRKKFESVDEDEDMEDDPFSDDDPFGDDDDEEEDDIF